MERVRHPSDSKKLLVQTLVLTLVVLIAVHGPVLGYKMYANVDEAYAAAIGSRLIDGFRLYEGAVSQRGPAMYYLFALIGKLHGWDNVLALRVWAFAFSVLHVLLVAWLGSLLIRPRAVLLAVCLTGYALAFGIPASDALALHGESIQLPFLLLSVGWGAFAVRARDASKRRQWLVLSGLACGVAITIKQSIALHALPLMAWLWIAARRNARKGVWRDLAVFMVPLATPSIFAIAHSASQGTLRSLYYYCVVYNRDVHMRPTTRFFPILANVFLRLVECPGYFVVLSIMIVAAGFALRRRLRAFAKRGISGLVAGFGPQQYLALHVFIAVVSASSMYRFFPHYFLPSIGFLALSFAATVEPQMSAQFGLTCLRGLQGLLLLLGYLGAVFNERIDGRVTHDRTHDMLGKYIRATTAPSDRIFVWGFSPTIYGYSSRRPAGRYVFHTYVTGLVPWFWDRLSVERARIVPGSVDALLGDLEREAPAIVVDAGSIMMARPMRAYEKPGAWLLANYCFEMRLGGFDVYRRKPSAALPCTDSRLPIPYDAIDWNGRPLGIPVARTLGSSFELSKLDYLKPVWFPNAPKPPAAGLLAVIEKRIQKEEAEAEADGFRVQHVEVDDAK